MLYVTHSAYLAQSARSTCDAHGYGNPAQEAEFLSYRELVETLRVPAGREVTFPAFRGWVERHRQSLLGSTASETAHALFQRYRQWLIETGLFDLNLVAHEWRPLAQPVCDFVVIDEVQDLTNVQLALVLACLKQPGQFLLCGDSNQIVHLPQHLWTTKRRKRSYVDQVLARAEVLSAYQPARRLWVRIFNGHYLPNPALLLRTHTGSEGPGWRPVYEALNLPWVAAGTAHPDPVNLDVTTLVEVALLRGQIGENGNGDGHGVELPADESSDSAEQSP